MNSSGFSNLQVADAQQLSSITSMLQQVLARLDKIDSRLGNVESQISRLQCAQHQAAYQTTPSPSYQQSPSPQQQSPSPQPSAYQTYLAQSNVATSTFSKFPNK
jgi:hypothetical protein